jgi:putative transcriptional regulator
MASLAGSFLVARASLKDSFFRRAVILLLQHGPDGAFGLVLNRPEKNKELPFSIHIGGPCKFQGLIMLHGQPEWVDEDERGAAEICPGVYLGDAESLKRVTDPEPGTGWRFRVFTGYSGWGPGQLERELAEGSWAIVEASAAQVFDVPNEEIWIRAAPSTIPEPSRN